LYFTKTNQQDYDYQIPTGVIILCIALAILQFAAMWKVFTKAGQPGLGRYRSYSEYLYYDKDRGQARLVGIAGYYSFSKHYFSYLAL